MIITGLRAENVLKYETLSLQNIPERGVIAISGLNESGKSSVGETVCFALFGRTFSLDDEDLGKLIRWGQSGCSAELTFRAGPDNDHYRVDRFLDMEGMHSARLARLGEEEQPIARGVDSVADALFEILGYDYEEFVDSFYLAQREITAPHPHSHTVKSMAGIAALEYVGSEFDDEIGEEMHNLERANERVAELDAELAELDVRPERLVELEAERSNAIHAQASNREQLEQLDAESTAYISALPRIEHARHARGVASFLRLLVLLLAMVTGVGWALLAQFPDAGLAETLRLLIDEHLPQWKPEYLPWLLYAFAGFAGLFLLLQLRVTLMDSRIRRLSATGRSLAEVLRRIHGTKVISGTREEADADAHPEAEADVPRPADTEIDSVCRAMEQGRAGVTEAQSAVSRESTWIREQMHKRQIITNNLERAIYDENERRRRDANLREEKAGVEEKRDAAQQRVDLRELAGELLMGASRHMSRQFNNDVRDLVSRTLPLFTENRYQHLQIEEDLSVRVFSGEKRDFMDLDEISSGTQRQIMLALRLALSQELVNRSVRSDQFLFLDEPFAFFDQERTRNSLAALPQLSDDINQVWIIAQEFPPGSEHGFAMQIYCDRQTGQLANG